MSRPARDEYLKKMRDRYRCYGGKAARTKLLDEFCEVIHHERKYANKLRRQHGRELRLESYRHDIFSGWTEVRPSWNRGQYSVCSAFGEIE